MRGIYRRADLWRSEKEVVRRPMKRLLTLTIAFTGVTALASMSISGQTRTAPAVKTSPSKGFTPAKTPWGDPDLQGTYTSDDCIGTPMQRPANLGEKLYF